MNTWNSTIFASIWFAILTLQRNKLLYIIYLIYSFHYQKFEWESLHILSLCISTDWNTMTSGHISEWLCPLWHQACCFPLLKRETSFIIMWGRAGVKRFQNKSHMAVNYSLLSQLVHTSLLSECLYTYPP